MAPESSAVFCWALLLIVLTSVPKTQGQVIINTTECGDGAATTWAMWGQWSGLGDCSAQCVGDSGKNTRQRSRACPVDVMGCSDVDQFEREYYSCDGTGTPVDGGYGPWSEWSDYSCTVICGRGRAEQTRSKQCDSPPASCGGRECRRAGLSAQVRFGLCFPGSCGASCSKFSPPIVRKLGSTPEGQYLLCHRGSIHKLNCPDQTYHKTFLRYGYYNSIAIYRICNRGSWY